MSNTYVSDSREALEARGYAVSDLNNHVLMSLPLESKVKDQAAALGTADRRFVCHEIDYF